MKKSLLIIWFVLLFSFTSNIKGTEKTVLEPSENDFIIGNENAPITIIEYASMSCSHCASFHNSTLNSIKSEYIDTGKVRCLESGPLNY